MKQHIKPFGDGVVTLRLIEERDLKMILDWRNRDETRVWFKTSGILSFENHQSWFNRYLDKEDDFFFLVEADGKPVGQCALYDIDRDEGSAEIGRFIVAPGAEGKGYITRCCNELTQFGVEKLRLPNLFVDVLENNERALKLYSRCGYEEESRQDGIIRVRLKSKVQEHSQSTT